MSKIKTAARSLPVIIKAVKWLNNQRKNSKTQKRK